MQGPTVDKDYCASSFLAFRYIEREGVEFADGLRHVNFKPVPDCEKTLVNTHHDIDAAIQKVFDGLSGVRLGILLSGGMDSANLAAYMPGADAYTFRFMNGEYQRDELSRAEYYAEHYGLNLHYVDISWGTVEENLDEVMRGKAAPVHSIEPQLLAASKQAIADGVEMLVVGESADLIFGGMDKLIAPQRAFDEFVERYMFTDPKRVLRNPADMSYLFERYRTGADSIDVLAFMDDVFAIESSSSYLNAFAVAGIPYVDPYAKLKMAQPFDMDRIRNGEPKYLVRELFHSKYPDIPIPSKVPMPRPVDFYFQDWTGPTRPEFLDGLDMGSFTGNQKWQMWCLERFLNLLEA